jgi:hypothetical protein
LPAGAELFLALLLTLLAGCGAGKTRRRCRRPGPRGDHPGGHRWRGDGRPGVTINEAVQVQPGQSVSIGRVPDVADADGERVAGTVEGGEALAFGPDDQVALLDSGGAVANTITV